MRYRERASVPAIRRVVSARSGCFVSTDRMERDDYVIENKPGKDKNVYS